MIKPRSATFTNENTDTHSWPQVKCIYVDWNETQAYVDNALGWVITCSVNSSCRVHAHNTHLPFHPFISKWVLKSEPVLQQQDTSTSLWTFLQTHGRGFILRTLETGKTVTASTWMYKEASTSISIWSCRGSEIILICIQIKIWEKVLFFVVGVNAAKTGD